MNTWDRRISTDNFFNANSKIAFIIAITIITLFCNNFAEAAAKIEYWQSKNGTQIYLINTHALPIIDVNISFAAGNSFVDANKAGLAEITNQLLENGSADLNEQQVADTLADIGAKLNLSSDWDRSMIQMRLLKSELNQSFNLLTKIISQPRFEAEIFQRQLVIMQQALKESLTRPEFIAQRTFWQNLYPIDHPYARVKTNESLSNISIKDVQDFYQQFYCQKNMVVSLVGDISRDEADLLVRKIAEKLPIGEKKTVAESNIPKLKKNINLSHPSNQAHVYIGSSGIKRGSSDFFPLLVANYTLGGGGFVSRLVDEVREKRGFAYSVSSSFQPLRLTGPFYINLQTKLDNKEKAIEISETTLREFITNGPNKAELAAAKSYLTSSFPLNLDSNSKLLSSLALIAFYQLPLTWLDEYQAKVAAVTSEQIKITLKKLIDSENLITVSVGGK